MAGITRKILRRRIGQVLKVKGRRALAASFLASSGSTTTTVNAPTLGAFPNEANYFSGARLSVVAGTNSGSTRLVTAFTQSSGTLTHGAFGSSQDATSDCELWRFDLDADQVNTAIDLAIAETLGVAPVFAEEVSLGLETGRVEYPLPSGLDWLYEVQVGNASPITGYAAANRSTGRALLDASARTRLAQKVVFESVKGVWGYLLHLSVVGSLTTTLTAELQTDSAGLPSGSVVSGTAATFAASELAAAPTFVLFRLPAPVQVAAGTYHLVLRSSGSADASNYVVWSEDATSPSFSDGSLAVHNGSSWSAVSGSVQVFHVLPDPWGDWLRWPASGWHITRDSVTQLSLIHRPPLPVVDWGYAPQVAEGRPVRLLGYRDAAAPTTDASTIEAHPNYVLAVACMFLLAGMDPEEARQDLAFWQRRTELMRAQQPVRARLLPNTVRIRAVA